MTLNEAITTRHSSRVFLPKPVPREILDDALDLARYSPSNTNIQPWRLFVLAGDPLKQLKAAVLAAASATDEPLRAIPPLPAHLEPLRKALGAQVYGAGFNVEWSDRIGRRTAVLRMFEFFDAPRRDCTLLLALTARGVGSCAEVAVAGYADLIKQQVGIPDSLAVICGLAVGYEDPEHAVNQIRPGRLPASDTTIMMGFEDEERIQE
ncbi:hypothetical protein G7054_g12456 [Neopestalotiopsis clavispora]|nr:hypothetical protein G7054_g12456 [Neopestalotiopsis clavispora]